VPGRRRCLSVIFGGSVVAERRYSADDIVAISHARAMLDEQIRHARGTRQRSTHRAEREVQARTRFVS
jgi:hypothetical protein